MNRTVKAVLIFVAVLVLIFTYGSFDPSASHWFPRCPFLSLTGWQCPGCGSQRSVHALLHLDVASAWAYNPLLILSLPYIFMALLLEHSPLKHRFPRLNAFLLHYRTIQVILIVVIAFWIGRNI